MIKLLLDTDYLLDLMVPDRPESESAVALAKLIDAGRFEAYVSAGSLKDVYYIGCKYADESIVRELISAFVDGFRVKAVDEETCRAALRSNEPDFEDGIIRAIAESNGIDVIITRDEKAFAKSIVKSMPAKTFCESMA